MTLCRASGLNDDSEGWAALDELRRSTSPMKSAKPLEVQLRAVSLLWRSGGIYALDSADPARDPQSSNAMHQRLLPLLLDSRIACTSHQLDELEESESFHRAMSGFRLDDEEESGGALAHHTFVQILVNVLDSKSDDKVIRSRTCSSASSRIVLLTMLGGVRSKYGRSRRIPATKPFPIDR